ncbi:MAG: diadenylate cyclase CdaA [Candidatus Metalachnospira sp.]|nr:diadenylate cyclase CdaA [Candidatus Metalachnospira sp.]
MDGQSLSSLLRGWNYTSMARPEMGVLDIIDILIVAYIVYKIIEWVKETRAWILFKGVVVIFLLYAIASLLQLNTIHWILSKTISVGIIAFVVLFQPELRKALEQLGNGKMIRGVFKFESQDSEDINDAKIVDEIVTAAEKMGSVRTGALVLIEKQVPLGDHIRTGIPIDAIVTSQLLINIFEHNTPLHDGAVVIRNGRVAAAACFLPLTENKVSMELGTRHRAAIGASEVSDANIIVVSEETGYISLARGGILYRNITPDELKNMLTLSKSDNNSVKKKIMRWKGRRSDDDK